MMIFTYPPPPYFIQYAQAQEIVEVRGETIPELIGRIADEHGIASTTAMKVAHCESGLRQFNDDGSILRGRINPKDTGVFQVNEYWHLADSKRLGFDIHTAEGNVRYAMFLMKRSGLQPWSASQHCWEDFHTLSLYTPAK